MKTALEVRTDIESKLASALADLGVLDAGHVSLEHPDDLARGDYATGIALKYGKAAGTNPRELAQTIVEKLGKIEGISTVDIAGPGFINFTLAPEALAASLEEACTSREWGNNSTLSDKTIMVEYTDPNPFKEFHIGHLMSNAIGESIARLLAASGAHIIRANYQGDVGLHVAKALWGAKSLYNPGNSERSAGLSFELDLAYKNGAFAYEHDAAAKAEIDTLNKRVYEIVIEGKYPDSIEKQFYDLGKEISLRHFENIYKILGTTFDHYFFESQTTPLGIELVRAHPDVFELSDGATVFRGEKYGLHTRVFLNSAGLPTYEAKDLGLIKLKQDTKGSVDRSITITASEQSDYFKVMLEAAKHLPEIAGFAGKTMHISHGMMRFAEGKMSSRLGNVITGELLINDLTQEAHTRAVESRADDHEQLAQDVAVAAIKYQILKQSSGKDIVFDKEHALSMEGDSGPYLQYAYARTRAIAEKARAAGLDAALDTSAPFPECARLVYRLPEVIVRATGEYEPHYLTGFLLELAASFNSWYAQEQILDGTPFAAHKLAITEAIGNTLRVGLTLLAIPAPEKM